MKCLIAIVFFFCLAVANAQKAVPFQLRDDQLITLDSSIMSKLESHGWKIKYMVRYGNHDTDTAYFGSHIQYFANNSFQLSGVRTAFRWEILGGKLLRHKVDSSVASKAKHDFPLQGDYGIYEMTDSTITFVKTMTSDLRVSHQYLLGKAADWEVKGYVVSTKVKKKLEFSEEVEYDIYDAYGNKVLSGKGKTVDTSDLPKGAYYAAIKPHLKMLVREKFFKG